MTDLHDTSKPADTGHRLDELFATIRGAMADNAVGDARSAGALACRAILGILDPSSRSGPQPPTPPLPSSAASPLIAVLGALGSVPREQLVETLLGGLRSILTQTGPTYLTRPAPAPPRSPGADP